MKKQYLKYIFAFILLLILVVPSKAFAITSTGDYTIESYDIDKFNDYLTEICYKLKEIDNKILEMQATVTKM